MLVLFLTVAAVLPLWAQSPKEAAPAVAEYIPPQPAGPPSTFWGFMGTMFKIAASLAVIIVFIYLTVYVLKNITAASGQRVDLHFGNLSVVDSLYLGPGKYLYLVKAAHEVLVLSASEKDLGLLSKITDPEVIEELIKKRDEKWQQTKPFREYLYAAQNTHQLRTYLRESLGSLKNMLKPKKPE
ncbi:MAG: flagellar biosynthetic protein FliO [Candidatus Omnitrophica bacterium]|nr:flagellar biosynthetic protein FliO [Candidatus Omnitrophota bacterium]